MGRLLDEPKFPVVDPTPGFAQTGRCHGMRSGSAHPPSRRVGAATASGAGQRLPAPSMRAACCSTAAVLLLAHLPASAPACAVGNFSMEDWGVFAGVTAVSFPLGFIAGAPWLACGAVPALPVGRCHSHARLTQSSAEYSQLAVRAGTAVVLLVCSWHAAQRVCCMPPQGISRSAACSCGGTV